MKMVVLKNVCKSYRLDSIEVPALTDVSLEIFGGRFTVISGSSGSGKSTLLNLIGCIDPPQSGEVLVAGERVYRLDDEALSDFRSRAVGVIFQNFNLLPVLTAFENVEYPLVIMRMPKRERRTRVTELLAAVGLADKARHFPGQLSGGQRQRVAIARALVASPQLVLADEPTANLDSRTGASILSVMRTLQEKHRISFVIASHDLGVIDQADDHITICDGRVARITRLAASTSSCPSHEYAVSGA